MDGCPAPTGARPVRAYNRPGPARKAPRTVFEDLHPRPVLRGRRRPWTALDAIDNHLPYVVAPIPTIDGQPATSALYTLYIGTNNPELFALYRNAGLPADFLPDNSTTLAQVDSTTTQAVFTIEGGQFDHTFTVLGYPPVEPGLFDTGATWLYDNRRGHRSLVWENDVQPNAPAVVSGSIEANTTLAALIPDFIHTMSGARFPNGYRRGNIVQTLTCTAA